ncbi:LOW QUALITY PROTEIN: protein RUFY3-like [Erethizon dorsatum]
MSCSPPLQPPPRAWRMLRSPGSREPFLLLSHAGGEPGGTTLIILWLMNMAKLSIKGLIESAQNLGRTLDSDYAVLRGDGTLQHGLKARKTFLGQNKSFWGPLKLVEKLVPEFAEMTQSVKDLPGLKTPVGRERAWLNLALMQKKLSEYMKALINKKECLSEFYELNALTTEEGALTASLLVGLKVIDANFCMKGEDLDSWVGVIVFSVYLKDGSRGSEGDGQITAILGQKNYVEEFNRHLNATVNKLQAKVDALEKSNTKLTEELAVANRIITLQEEMECVKEESSYIESNQKGSKQDRTTGGQALSEARKHLKEEAQSQLDVEKELELQISLWQEMELVMKMLEKDVCEKLRQQLDHLRALKHELALKLQNSDLGVKQKSELNSHLEKTNQMAATVKQLEQMSAQQTHHLSPRVSSLHAVSPVTKQLMKQCSTARPEAGDEDLVDGDVRWPVRRRRFQRAGAVENAAGGQAPAGPAQRARASRRSSLQESELQGGLALVTVAAPEKLERNDEAEGGDPARGPRANPRRPGAEARASVRPRVGGRISRPAFAPPAAAGQARRALPAGFAWSGVRVRSVPPISFH